MATDGDRHRVGRLALAQTHASDDVQANLAAADAFVRDAADQGASLLAFPEVFLFVGSREAKLRLAQPLDGPWVAHFREAAARHGLWLLLGSIHERIADNAQRVHNTSVLIDAVGNVAGVYRKLRLFDVDLPDLTIRESETILPGDEQPPVVDTPIGRVGLTICFDVRYPDLYQRLRRQGAELVFVPSNFTVPTGAAHWEPLLRARAIENQFYVAAPAQVGARSGAATSYGHSALVDPWGVVTAMAPDKPTLLVGDIDLDHVRHVRSVLPLQDS